MANLPNETGRSLGDYSDEWWDDKIDRLARLAQSKLDKSRWMGINGGDPPSATDGKDIVLRLLEKVLTGKRNWNPDSEPDLFRFLCGELGSLINTLARSVANRKTVRISAAGESPETGRYWSQNLQSTGGPEDTSIEKDMTDWFWRFAESLESEPDLQEVVLAALEGARKRSDVAEMLNVSEEEIDNRRKRLARRRRDYVDRKSAQTLPKGDTRRG